MLARQLLELDPRPGVALGELFGKASVALVEAPIGDLVLSAGSERIRWFLILEDAGQDRADHRRFGDLGVDPLPVQADRPLAGIALPASSG